MYNPYVACIWWSIRGTHKKDQWEYDCDLWNIWEILHFVTNLPIKMNVKLRYIHEECNPIKIYKDPIYSDSRMFPA